MESNKKTDSFKNESLQNNNDKNKDNINNNLISVLRLGVAVWELVVLGVGI